MLLFFNLTHVLEISRFEVPICRFFWTFFQNLQIRMWWALQGLAVETTTSLSETRNICSKHENNEGLSDQANRKWGTDGSGRLTEDWNEWQLCFDNWHYGFHYFLGTIALLRKKITECTSKLASLYYSVMNVYAKCRM